MKKNRAQQIAIILVLGIILFIVLIPVIWSVSLSFDRKATTSIPAFSLLPKQFSMFNYQAAAKLLDLTRYYLNTLFLTVVNTVLSVFTALMCGYAFAKGKFFGKKFLFYFMLIVMMVPFESRMIPLYLQYKKWGMINTYWPLILGQFAYVYGIFFARQNIETIPDSLRESACIDGANEWTVFLKIILPLSKPIIATLSILQMIAFWNSYLWPLVVIRDNAKQVISVGVALFNAQENKIYYGPRMAVAVLSAIPMIIMFLILQKYIVQSIAVSGMKN
jgi:multiple sugar transport system permease protein